MSARLKSGVLRDRVSRVAFHMHDRNVYLMKNFRPTLQAYTRIYSEHHPHICRSLVRLGMFYRVRATERGDPTERL